MSTRRFQAIALGKAQSVMSFCRHKDFQSSDFEKQRLTLRFFSRHLSQAAIKGERIFHVHLQGTYLLLFWACDSTSLEHRRCPRPIPLRSSPSVPSFNLPSSIRRTSCTGPRGLRSSGFESTVSRSKMRQCYCKLSVQECSPTRSAVDKDRQAGSYRRGPTSWPNPNSPSALAKSRFREFRPRKVYA